MRIKKIFFGSLLILFLFFSLLEIKADDIEIEENSLILNSIREKYNHLDINYDKINNKFIFNHNSDEEVLKENNIELLSKQFIKENQDVIKININNLKKIKEEKIDKKTEIISYTQEYDNIPIYNSYSLDFVSKNGKLVLLRDNHFQNIEVNTNPRIDKEEAVEFIKEDINLPNLTLIDKSELVIFPLDNNEFKLTWKIDLPLTKDPIAKWTYFVDTENGEIIEKINNIVFEDVTGNVQGRIYPASPLEERENRNFKEEYTYAYQESGNRFYSGADNYLENYILILDPIDLTNINSAQLNFKTKYEIEPNYDFGYVFVLDENLELLDLYEYTGFQDEWVNEEIDISGYEGNNVYIEFLYLTDYSVVYEGWYLDDIEIIVNDENIFSDSCDNFDNWESEGFEVVNNYELIDKDITNEDGNYILTNLENNAIIRSWLYGPYADVYNADQFFAYYINEVEVPSENSWNWIDHDESYQQEESNVFYHMNLIHDYFTKGEPFNIEEMDYSMPSYVQFEEDECNAFSDSYGIYFFGSGEECEATSLLSDVIYHEYTHNVVYNIYYPYNLPYINETGAMNEGWADYFAATYNDDSCVGEGFFLDNEDCLRDLNNDNKLPDDWVGEVHKDSLIFSGSLWDLRSRLGQELTDDLVIKTMRLRPYRFSEYLDFMLIIDDDNENLNDGTPHSSEICSSFNRHGILSIYCLPKVIINEFLPDPIGDENAPMPDGEWVELYNIGDEEVNLEGFVLYDLDNTHELYITEENIEGNLILQPNEYLVVYRNGDGNFSLNNGGDEMRLYNGYPTDESNIIDEVSYESAEEGYSISLINNLWENTIPTPGEENIHMIQCGDTITEDTTLTSDLLNCTEYGLIIGSNDITLDCDNHLIDGDNSETHKGIYIENKNNLNIKNCNIQEFSYGIWLYDSFNNNIWNNSLTDNEINAYEEESQEQELNNNWNLTDIGNYWSDFEENEGYPYYYEIGGNGNGIDWHPLNQDTEDEVPERRYHSIYDDFSEGELNENLWNINGDLDEYYLDSEEENYHTVQNDAADRYVNLIMSNYRFTPGEVVEYDINYINGEGNRMTNIIINNIELNRHVGLMGYWNEVQQAGNDFGTYHFRVEFIESGVDIFVTNPDEETIQIIDLPQMQSDFYSFGVGTRTGHNGTVHMSFDNFIINPEENLIGDGEDINTNINNLNLELGESNEGVRSISFMEGDNLILQFDFNFNETNLDLSEITIQKQEGSEFGSILIEGITLLEGNTKKVYVDNLNNDINTLCIKDAEIASIDEISEGCDLDNEVFITCDGNEKNGYTCNDLGNRYEILGLTHSGIKEQAAPAGNDGGNGGDTGGGSGGGGGGSGGGGGGGSSTPTITQPTEEVSELEYPNCRNDEECNEGEECRWARGSFYNQCQSIIEAEEEPEQTIAEEETTGGGLSTITGAITGALGGRIVASIILTLVATLSVGYGGYLWFKNKNIKGVKKKK